MPLVPPFRTLRALAVAAAILAPCPAPAQEDRPIHLPFRPAIGETVTYRAVERDTTSFQGKEKRQVWRQTIDLTPVRPLPDGGYEATITIRDVAVDEGGDDDMLYRVARAVEGRPVPVRLSRGGYVEGIVGWPSVKAQIKAATARLPVPESRGLAALLDRLDATEGHSLLARPLLLASAGYRLPARRSGGTTETPNYQGPAAYVFPGRTATSGVVAVDRAGNRVAIRWRIATDPAVAARELGPILRSVAPIAGASSPADLPRAQAELGRMLSDADLEFTEEGGAAYDFNRHVIRKAVHRLAVKAGDYRRETATELERVEP